MKRANDIGQHIAKIRRMRDLSQEATIAKIQCLGGEGYDMTVQMLKNIESGRTKVYHWQIRCIREGLRCTYEEIFLGPSVNGQDLTVFLKKERRRNRR